MTACDVAVVGAGAFGAAATWALAKQGAHVITIDAHGPTHARGSSHGEARIFRRAYWEGTQYLPLLHRARELWSDLEATHGERLMLRTGAVFTGPREAGVVERSLQVAHAGGIPCELWDAARLRAQYPWFTPGDDMNAIYEPSAGAILAARGRLAMLDDAIRLHASIRFGEEATTITATGSRLAVQLRSGEAITCSSVILAAGPWMQDTSGAGLGHVLNPVRVPVYWFRHDPRLGTRPFPAFLHESSDGKITYGVPEWEADDPLIKIGFHNHQQRPGDPWDAAAPELSAHLRYEMAATVARIFTGVDPKPVRWRWCWYTLTPDGSFIVDRSPVEPRIIRVSACSGHGFKFAPAIGEAAASLALLRQPGTDLTPFSAARFPQPGASVPGPPRGLSNKHFPAANISGFE
jgi:sarcosine oxidase